MACLSHERGQSHQVPSSWITQRKARPNLVKSVCFGYQPKFARTRNTKDRVISGSRFGTVLQRSARRKTVHFEGHWEKFPAKRLAAADLSHCAGES